MEKQISSLDLHYLVKELKFLENSRVDKIYQFEKNNLLIQLHKTDIGKKLLNILNGEAMFIVGSKEEESYPFNFSMLLRKHLNGFWLRMISQIEPERIIKLEFEKGEHKALYLEFLGKGNIILCDNNGLIINSLTHHEFKDRTVMPKIKYEHPKMKYNYFGINIDDLGELFKNSGKESVVKCLAVELGLGGVYSEEICLLSNIDKKINPCKINLEGIRKIHSIIKSIINKNINPEIIIKDDKVIDVAPIILDYYSGFEKRKFKDFSSALEFFYSHFRPKIKSEYEKQLESLKRIIEEQKANIEGMHRQEKENRAKGELFYVKYQELSRILEDLNNAAKSHSWKEIKSKLKGHEVLKEINEKEKKVVVEV